MTDTELKGFIERRRQTLARRRRWARMMVGSVVVTLVAAAGVFAYFLAHGTAAGNASVGVINPPTNVVAKAANGSSSLGASPVTITWDAPVGGATPTSYKVVRDDGTTPLTLSGCGLSSCTDSGVGNGTYTYHVTSRYGTSWNSVTADSNSIQVQNQVSTTTTLASSHNPSVVGETVTYTATVNAGVVVPGGTVDFKDGSTTVCSAKPLTGSSPYTATCQQTYSAPSTGESITAVYSGDSNTFESTSNTVSEVVNKAATTTAVVSSANPSVVGQQVTYTATVSVIAPGSATPTGTVDFKDGSTTVCSATVLSGSAPFTATCQQTYNSVSAGHSITAVYSGAANTTGSTSSALSQVVNAAATTTTLSSGTNPSVFGQSVTFSVTVSANAPGSGTPTGSVAIKDGAATVCTATLSGGAGSCSSSALSVATHSLSATYAGTANFSTSTSSPALSQVVNKASTTTTITSSVNPSVTGQSVTYTATVSAVAPGTGTPTGTVNFTDTGTTISGCAAKTLNGSGQATCAVTYSAGSGNHTHIAGVYSGSGSFLTSTSSDFSQAVNKANTSTALASSVNPSVSGQSVTYTATVSASAPGAGTPTGSMQFKDGSSTISGCATQTVNGSGQATCTVSGGYLASNGSRTISAVYSGDGDFNTSTSSNLTQAVNKAATTTSVVTAKTPTVVGEIVAYTGTVSATAPGTGNPSAGNIEFFDGGTAIAACGGIGGLAVDGTGNAVCSLTYAATGSHTITARYLGTSGDYNASGTQSSPITQTVNQASTTTTLGSSANPSVFGQSVTLTATVTPVAPAGGTPTGNVNFKDGATTITGCGTQALNGSGQATCTTSALTTGTHATITAVYAGTTAYATSTSSNFTQTVNKADTTTTVVSGSNPSVTGQSLTFTATVAPVSPGAGTPTGTVNFTSDGVTITGCGAKALSSGQATCATSFNATNGNHTIAAVYSSDTNFNTSTATGITQTVNKASTTTTLASNNNPAVTGGSATYTATVAPVAPGVGSPTGTVTFTDGGTTISGCGAQTVSGGQATCTQSGLTTGSHTIVATYNADSNFATSTSANFTESVNIFAGIDFVKTGSSGTAGACDYSSITAVTCPVTSLGNGAATVTGTIRLINVSHTAVANTGSSISLSYVLAGQAGGLSPASPQSITTGSSTTPAISFTMSNGNNKSATLTATVTLNGATYTVTVGASS